MKYRSTRGSPNDVSFEYVVMNGMAEDGGLFVPTVIPSVTAGKLQMWSNLSYVDLAVEVMSLFIDSKEILHDELVHLVKDSYASFRHDDIVPLVSLTKSSVNDMYNDVHILELHHGPTYAFKDVALQFLGNLFEFFLKREALNVDVVDVENSNKGRLTVVGATSGDTGSAAIYGLRGKVGVDVFILHPLRRLSSTQEKQMTTILDDNVHNIAIRGTFDDAQNIVKCLFADKDFNATQRLGAVNSINWARIMAQITYYFHAYFQARRQCPDMKKCLFSVPTGNFGDILAGYYARKMGIPGMRLVVATNRNDILHRFFSAGDYSMSTVVPTLAPSMDIQISSNFERYLFYLAGEDSTVLRGWMKTFATTGTMPVPKQLAIVARADFSSSSVSETEILSTIRDVHALHNYLLCPHSATGICTAALRHNDVENGESNTETVYVALATAHPGKFSGAVKQAIGREVPLPPQLSCLDEMPTRCETLDANVDAVRLFISSTTKHLIQKP